MNPSLTATFAAVAQGLIAQFGAPATYTDREDDEHAIAVVLTREQAAVGDYGPVSETQWTAEIDAAAIPAPSPNDQIVFAPGVVSEQIGGEPSGDDDVFVVRGIVSGDGFTWKLAVTHESI